MGKNAEMTVVEDLRSTIWYILLIVMVILGYISGFHLEWKDDFSASLFELFMNIPSLYGTGALGGIIIIKKWVENFRGIFIYKILLLTCMLVGIAISFIVGINLKANLDFQKEITNIKTGEVFWGKENINIFITDPKIKIHILPSGENDINPYIEYVIESISIEEADIWDKFKNLPVWIFCKLDGRDFVVSVTINVQDYFKNRPLNEPFKDSDFELLVGVRDILALWNEEPVYFKNQYTDQGKIRYKKKGLLAWSDWETIVEKDLLLPVSESTVYTFNWHLRGKEEEVDWSSADGKKLIFYNSGEMYLLNNEVLYILMEKAQIEKPLENWRISVEFLKHDNQKSEDVEGELLGQIKYLDTSEESVDFLPRIKAGDDVLIYCEVKGIDKGYYTAYIARPNENSTGNTHTLNWVHSSEKDDTRLIIKLYFEEKIK